MTDLIRRHRAVTPSWLATYYDEPIELTHGEGRHVWDSQGRRYLDFFGGILTTMTAHALPEVTKAVSEQAGRILHILPATRRVRRLPVRYAVPRLLPTAMGARPRRGCGRPAGAGRSELADRAPAGLDG